MSAVFFGLLGGSRNDVVISDIHGASPATSYPWAIASNGTTAVVASRVTAAEVDSRIYSTSDGITFVAPTITDSTANSYASTCRSAVYANSKFVFGAANPVGGQAQYMDGDSAGASFTLRDSSAGVVGGMGLIWDGTRFLSVGGTKLATSTTGLNNSWSNVTINAGYNFYGIAYDGSIYVAVGQSGAVYTSTDRSTWTARTSGVTDLLHSITYDSGLGLFVAVGYSAGASIITSPDGITWTSRTNPTTGGFRKVVWSSAHSKFFAVGNRVIYSSDGINWIASSYLGSSLYDIAFIGTTALVTQENGKQVAKSDSAFIF